MQNLEFTPRRESPPPSPPLDLTLHDEATVKRPAKKMGTTTTQHASSLNKAAPKSVTRDLRQPRLPADILCGILMDKNAALGLPSWRAIVAGNAYLESMLFSDTNLKRFALRNELAGAAKLRNLFNHGRLSPGAGEPRYLQTVIFERWSLKTATELRWIDAIESILTPSTAVLTAHLRAEERAKATEEINQRRMKEIADTCRPARYLRMPWPMGFDCALTLLRLSDERGLALSTNRRFHWAFELYKEPSFLLAVALNYPEFLDQIDVSVINETYVAPQAKQHYVFREERSEDIQDSDAFVFDGVLEEILIKGMERYPEKMSWNRQLFDDISNVQQQVASTAIKKNMSTSEAAIWLGQQEKEKFSSRNEILATRALTIDLDLLGPAIGLPKNAREYLEAEKNSRQIALLNMNPDDLRRMFFTGR